MIATREAVRAAVNRALALDPAQGDKAIEVVAQAMGLDPAAVREALGSPAEVTA